MPRLNASQSTRVFTWARRPPIRIDLAPPLFNTLYPILQSSGGFRLRYLRYQQQNDEVAAKDLTLEGFIDGEVVNSLVGADSGGVNDYFLLTVLDNQWNFGATGVLTRMGDEGTLYLICKTCDLQMRITTALGTNQEIHALLEYDAWEEL